MRLQTSPQKAVSVMKNNGYQIAHAASRAYEIPRGNASFSVFTFKYGTVYLVWATNYTRLSIQRILQRCNLSLSNRSNHAYTHILNSIIDLEEKGLRKISTIIAACEQGEVCMNT